MKKPNRNEEILNDLKTMYDTCSTWEERQEILEHYNKLAGIENDAVKLDNDKKSGIISNIINAAKVVAVGGILTASLCVSYRDNREGIIDRSPHKGVNPVNGLINLIK